MPSDIWFSKECSATPVQSTLVATRVDSLAFCDVRFFIKSFYYRRIVKISTNKKHTGNPGCLNMCVFRS